MTKKLLFSTMVLCFFFLYSCQKDEGLDSSTDLETSVYSNEYGEYQKQLVVYDETKENSLYYVVYANDSSDLATFLETHSFTLICDVTDEPDWSTSEDSETKSVSSLADTTSVDTTHMVSMELITENISENISSYYLTVEYQNNLKSITVDDYQGGGSYYNYTTKGNFLGIVHQGFWDDNSGDEYHIKVNLTYKKRKYFSSWRTWKYVMLYGYLGSGEQQYWACWPNGTGGSYYKVGIGVFLDKRDDKYGNYYIAYNKSSFRGHDCSIGSYDGANCYVGTPPTGTTAFIYNGHYYYTAKSGNQCPYSGSWFDGANCYVGDIPSSTEGFIYNNNWYVKPDIIED
jgi:hypothetical protein